MNKIFKGQSSLRFKICTYIDLTNATELRLKYKKPDDTESYFVCSTDQATEGIMFYDVQNDTEIDQSGDWVMWAWILWPDTRISIGDSVTVHVFEEGN